MPYTVFYLVFVRAALADEVVPHVHGGGQDQHVATGWAEDHDAVQGSQLVAYRIPALAIDSSGGHSAFIDRQEEQE